MKMNSIIKDMSTQSGLKWQFKPENGEWADIKVPEGGWRTQGYTCDAGTYRTILELPEYELGSVVRIAFAAVNFGAEVYIGNDEEDLVQTAYHLNGWMPFFADITSHVEPGSRKLLVVKVKGRNKYMRDGKYLVPQGGTWLEGLADGIIRGIELQILPSVLIDDVYVVTNVEEDTIHPQAVIYNSSRSKVTVNLSVSLDSWNNKQFDYPQIPDSNHILEPGERRTIDLGTHGWGAGPESYWWANVPYHRHYRATLHNLELTLKMDDQPVHRLVQRFGFRQFQAKGAHYYLNGVRCNLRGDNQQEANFGTDAYGTFPGFGEPTPENPGWPEAVHNLLRLNFNVLRIHQVPGTPYMLDVCDELGLMIVAETPIRGSEGMEDFVGGRDNMIHMARELALRERNHPSVVLWSAANEIWGQRGLALALQAAILAVDDTRPVIIDGVEEMGPEIINMEHYVGGFGVLPEIGGTPRTDRPYGETECVWPMDNSWKGFAWMATATRIRRLKNNADIRNYVFNNAWSNYVPGQKPELQHLEKKIKNISPEKSEFWSKITSDMEILPAIEDPWNHPNIMLMQKCFHPVTVCDIDFDEKNKFSNEDGDWPVEEPTVEPGSRIWRQLAVFNDEFEGENIRVQWEARIGSPDGAVHAMGQIPLRIPLGEFRQRNVEFAAPSEECRLFFILKAYKGSRLCYVEDMIRFNIKNRSTL